MIHTGTGSLRQQAGFSYVEVLVATFILSIAMVPAMEALQSGIQGAGIHETLTQQQFALNSRAEQVLADSFSTLLVAAATAGNKATPSSYSDTAGSAQRALVFLSFYDAGNTDNDGDPFTIADPNTDADNNPYTGAEVDISLLWVGVEIEGSGLAIETLVSQ